MVVNIIIEVSAFRGNIHVPWILSAYRENILVLWILSARILPQFAMPPVLDTVHYLQHRTIHCSTILPTVSTRKEWTKWAMKLKKDSLKEWNMKLKEWTHTMKEWTKIPNSWAKKEYPKKPPKWQLQWKKSHSALHGMEQSNRWIQWTPQFCKNLCQRC